MSPNRSRAAALRRGVSVRGADAPQPRLTDDAAGRAMCKCTEVDVGARGAGAVKQRQALRDQRGGPLRRNADKCSAEQGSAGDGLVATGRMARITGRGSEF